jgi:putative lumazine-binding protein
VSVLTSEKAAIVQAALDYVEGWFDGDAGRMDRALHPELAKRSLDESGELATITAQEMVDATARGVGRRGDPEERRVDVQVEHVHESIANVTLISVPYVDYLQLARTADGWKIVNVLWRRR